MQHKPELSFYRGGGGCNMYMSALTASHYGEAQIFNSDITQGLSVCKRKTKNRKKTPHTHQTNGKMNVLVI